MNFIDELMYLFKSRTYCIGVQTLEEERAIGEIIKAYRKFLSDKGIERDKIYLYSSASGIRIYNNIKGDFDREEEECNDSGLLRAVKAFYTKQLKPESVKEDILFICKDMNTLGDPRIDRSIKDMVDDASTGSYIPLVIIKPHFKLSPTIQNVFKVIDFSTPDRGYISSIVNSFCIANSLQITDEYKERIINAAKGLTAKEIGAAIRLSIAKYGTIDIKLLINEKIQIIKKSGVLSYREPKTTMDDIGGHSLLKQWIKETKLCMSKDASLYGVDKVKGFISTGLPGSGKSAIAEAIADYFGLPMVVFDLSKIMGGIVGESERQTTQAFNVIDSLGGCVILVDESEKVLGGIKSSNNSDGGTMARVFSIFLDRMNNNTNDFYIFTSNDMSVLPPELTRAGRLDTKWFFNFPTVEERKDILKIHFGKRNHKDVPDDILNYCVSLTDKYTGAELEQLVKNSIKFAFIRTVNDEDKSITKEDIDKSIADITTVYTSNRASVDYMISNASKQGLKQTSKLSSSVKPLKFGVGIDKFISK